MKDVFSNQYSMLIGKCWQYGPIIVLILSFAFGWYAMMLLAIVQLCMILHRTISVRRMAEVREKMSSFGWERVHGVVRSILQVVKCSQMIERGYSSRSNTNIILQEEKQLQKHFILPSKQDEMVKDVIAMVADLNKLVNMQRALLQQEKEEGDELAVLTIDSFRALFSTYRQVDALIQEVNRLSLIFQARMRMPTLDPSIKYKLAHQYYSQILPFLATMALHSQHLQSSLTNYSNALQLTPQFQPYLSLLIGDTLQEDLLQSLQAKINTLQLQTTQRDDKHEVQHSLQLVEGNHSLLHQAPSHQGQPQPLPASQRKQFIRKLDVLLMVGLARRRQEQLQRQLQEQQQLMQQAPS